MDTSCNKDALKPAVSFWMQTFGQRSRSLSAARASSLAESGTNVQAWEEEIASLHDVLIAAKRQRNASTRACIIPAEILSRIFEELTTMSPIDIYAKTSTTRRGWLTVVHVCQHWRSVARAHSSLWHRITFTSASLWDLFVESAGDRPLIVAGCASARHSGSEKFLEVIPLQLPRIKELSVHAQMSVGPENRAVRSGFLAFMHSLNSSREPLNQLEMLTLKPSGYTGRSLRAKFMKYRVPKLRRVTLQGMALPLGVRSQSITHLELIDILSPDANAVLRTLEHLNCLEDLILDHSSRGSHGVAAQVVRPPIALPHVRRFIVKNSLAVCTAYLKSVVVHPLAYIEVDASNTSHLHDEDLGELGAVLFTSEQFVPLMLELFAYEGRLLCDVIAWGDEGEGGCYGPTQARQPTPTHPHPWPGIKATLPVPVPLVDSPCAVIPIIMTDFLSQVPKETFDLLALKGHMHWDPQQVLSAFAGAESIATLIVDDVPPDTVAALCVGLCAASPEMASPLLPDLQSIVFEHIDFGCPAEECNGEESAVYHVRDALHHRALRGRALEMLTFNSCSISVEYVEDWACHVKSLEWDGHVGQAHDRHSDNEGDGDEDEGGGFREVSYMIDDVD